METSGWESNWIVTIKLKREIYYSGNGDHLDSFYFAESLTGVLVKEFYGLM